ncbi:serine/threonine-protein phosphatase 4 regulatory subunit 3-like isoform X2 [Momordica charantia]|uniref:Serine/threonine-protein phosphatase 4 regulatory subunit 3-like isoform X2 n=1 Tax=Momordica charantia TaxID=3673 RepID=A0A6J1C9M8_MOMCH|nr:serine/threonine-protein phosphatase 4 regulatory subunit 3-like isoform X2 [Momordica charantia]
MAFVWNYVLALLKRVKVYRLNDDGKWDDQGTGHVTVDYMERSEELGLFVIDEEDNETLLLHRISSDDIYQKQEDTIISWKDPEYSTELALSFQEATGCSFIWDNICSVQRNLHFSTLSNETFHSVNSELRELPAVDLTTLPLIHKTVVESGIADQMRLTELLLNDQDFFRKLMNLFRICEDLDDTDGLHMIFKIVRGIVLLNSPQIFEKIFSDEMIMDIIGSLEYDPEVPHTQHFRNFLKEHVVFKEAIPIKNPLVLSKIHQTYKVGYLKDVVLTRILDDSMVANLNSIIHANNAIVVSLLKDDNTFIQELFARLRSPATFDDSKKDLVYFLHEFCSLSKSLQMVQQLRLFRDLMNEGIFDIITDVLQSGDEKLVLTGTDILILFLNQDPNLLRTHVVRQEGFPLFGLLVKGMVTDFGDNMHCQFLEILRNLLDTYALSGVQRDTIIEIFYEKHLGQLIDIITASCPTEGFQSTKKIEGAGVILGDTNSVKPEILSNICELLCFCVLQHPYRIKSNFLLNNTIDKVVLLTQRREKYLVVAAVRFIRTILSRHDEHLINYFVKNNVLKPIVDAFVANGSRYNLLNSAVLELLEYIRKENLKLLVRYIIDSFWNQLSQFENWSSIQALKVKYEQCLENCETKGTPNTLDPRKRNDERALEKEEEDYFNEDSDEDDTASASVAPKQKVPSQPALSNGVTISYPPASPRSGGLVDYDDDDDDEDYKPPQRKQPDTSDEDNEMMEALRKKRKLAPQEEPEMAKKQQLVKKHKPKDGVFASLCSTLSQAVLPGKKTMNASHTSPCTSYENKSSAEENHKTDPAISSSSSDSSNCNSDEENHREKESAASRSYSSSSVLHITSENRQLGGDDYPLIPPKSSPEMTVNGSLS